MICKQHPLWNLHVEASLVRQVVHQREIRRPLATFCAESDWPLVAERDHCWGEGGHWCPEMGRGCSQKKIFQPFGPQFGLKIGGGAGPSPGSALQRTSVMWHRAKAYKIKQPKSHPLFSCLWHFIDHKNTLCLICSLKNAWEVNCFHHLLHYPCLHIWETLKFSLRSHFVTCLVLDTCCQISLVTVDSLTCLWHNSVTLPKELAKVTTSDSVLVMSCVSWLVTVLNLKIVLHLTDVTRGQKVNKKKGKKAILTK